MSGFYISRFFQKGYIIAFSIMACASAGICQPKNYTTANAHSHNDYEQRTPFFTAYQSGFGSIETDIHLVNGKLLVGHDNQDLNAEKTLERLYFSPLQDTYDGNRKLIILIDIKTDAQPTLDALIQLLKKYPKITRAPGIKIIISGNRPDPDQYRTYPPFIWFDGRIGEEYSTTALEKIALLSQDFFTLAGRSESFPVSETALLRMKAAIEQAHALQKPTRLWANPDHPEGWNFLMNLGIDYINTDHIEKLTSFLNKKISN